MGIVYVFYGLGLIVGLVSLVCFIMVLIKSFQNSGAGIGIVGIITCGIATFIWGWIKAKELNLTKLMLTWTAAIVLGICFNGAAGVFAAKALAESPEARQALEEMQKAMKEAQQAVPPPAPAPQN